MFDFHIDLQSIDLGDYMDILEIIVGFVLGNAARLRFLKPRDWTIMLQVAIFGIRTLKWVTKHHHPLKRVPSYRGVDQDLTAMHERILREHEEKEAVSKHANS